MKSRKYEWFYALIAMGLGLFSATDVVYLHWVGISWVEIGYLLAVFSVTILVFELPSSIFADMWSARRTLQAGLLTHLLGLVLLGIPVSFEILLLANILAGIGVALTSGTVSKIMISELEVDSEKALIKIDSRIERVSMLATGVGAVTGVAVHAVYPPLVWFVAAGFIFVSFLVTLSFPEAKKERAISIIELLKSLLPALCTRPMWISILTAVSAVAPFMLWQTKIGADSFYSLAFVGFAIGLVGAASAHITTRATHNVNLLFVMAANIGAIVIFAVASDIWLTILAFLLHVSLQTHMSIRAYAMFQASLSNENRATITSLSSLGDSALFAVASIAVGALVGSAGYLAASLVSCLIVVVLAIVVYPIIRKTA